MNLTERWLALFVSALMSASCAHAANLKNGWFIQDSDLVGDAHAEVSKQGFNTSGWHPATVPSTIIGSLLRDQNYLDPGVGDNLLKLPGTGTYYTTAKDYGMVVTPKDSPFGHAWWYRLEFQPDSRLTGKKFDLDFYGITYGAEIWLNGHKLADANDTEGTYRAFTFDVSDFIIPGKPNVLAVLVNPPQPEDLSASWVDWNPTPPDKNMGIWREVELRSHDHVAIRHPMVTTYLNSPQNDLAQLLVEAEITNSDDQSLTGNLKGTIGAITFSQNVTLKPHETRTVVFSPQQFSQLQIKNPELWWPAQMGSPHLETLQLAFSIDSKISDLSTLHFGIRTVASVLDKDGGRLFYINGRPIQIRGAGWASDLFLRFDQDRMEKEFAYVRDLRLNTIRLEGRFEPQSFLDLADQYGILVMPGWTCCNAWQEGAKWPAKNLPIAGASMRDQIYEFRAHPSVFVFLYGSDEAPPENVEQIYVDALAQHRWPNPVLNSAAARETKLSGKSGVKMEGPYDYVPPSYWYVDHKLGGAFGFSTEISPGPSIPQIESIYEFIPSEHLWPIDSVWNLHRGANDFSDIHIFKEGIDRRYGKSENVEDFVMKSQVANYDNQRAMFEAYGKNKYHSATGVIQWMLNSSWPSINWNLYDYYLRTGGAYFGTKKATEPLHIQYSYDDQTVVIVNSTYADEKNLTAQAEVLDFGMNSIFHESEKLDAPADISRIAMKLPELKRHGKTYFVKLTLKNALNEIISRNFYWLSNQTEIYQWDKTDFKYTPVSREGDLSQLGDLDKVVIDTTARIRRADRSGILKIKNSSETLAFALHAKLLDSGTGKEILPVIWEDGFISLTPGESRQIKFSFERAPALVGQPQIRISGWNVDEQIVH